MNSLAPGIALGKGKVEIKSGEGFLIGIELSFPLSRDGQLSKARRGEMIADGGKMLIGKSEHEILKDWGSPEKSNFLDKDTRVWIYTLVLDNGVYKQIYFYFNKKGRIKKAKIEQLRP